MKTIKINRIQTAKDNVYFEAVFNGGNLLCFSFAELLKQLKEIYNINLEIFKFNAN